jgi:hypothetical protein
MYHVGDAYHVMYSRWKGFGVGWCESWLCVNRTFFLFVFKHNAVVALLS